MSPSQCSVGAASAYRTKTTSTLGGGTPDLVPDVIGPLSVPTASTSAVGNVTRHGKQTPDKGTEYPQGHDLFFSDAHINTTLAHMSQLSCLESLGTERCTGFGNWFADVARKGYAEALFLHALQRCALRPEPEPRQSVGQSSRNCN